MFKTKTGSLCVRASVLHADFIFYQFKIQSTLSVSSNFNILHPCICCTKTSNSVVVLDEIGFFKSVLILFLYLA